MKFEIISSYYCADWDTIESVTEYGKEANEYKKILLSDPLVIEEDGQLFIEVSTLLQLQSFVTNIRKKILENEIITDSLFDIDSIVVDFKHMQIQIYDYYIE